MAKIVRVSVTLESSGVLVAESPDLPGLLAVSRDRAILDQLIPQHIRDLYAARGVDVLVTEAESPIEERMRPWIAVPFAVVDKQRVLA